MTADIKGALAQIEKSWRTFEHNYKPMTKKQVQMCLEYADSKGYKTTADISDVEIDAILFTMEKMEQ